VTLQELSQLACSLSAESAPDWLLGCFQRRSITFYTGACDTTTRVYWLQARGLSADFRVQPSESHSDFAWSQKDQIGNFEGGIGRTAWSGHTMKWFGWTSFQLHDKWCEPGVLKRVGDCVIEFAPSGAYVEDWRLQPSRPGPVVALRMVREWDVKVGAATHSGGGLIVCGDHAALVRGRTRNLHGLGRLSDVARDAPHDSELRRDLFAFEASYAIREGSSDYKILLSTNPSLIGKTLPVLDGFSYDVKTQLVTQRVRQGGTTLERLFSIDTLEPEVSFSSATSVNAEAEEWLHRESDTLLAFASTPSDSR
jgi:hypothetical protein